MSTPPRRWFAFRLSTLVLAVWTIAAGGLIWFRWAPWYVEQRIPERYCSLSEDRRHLLTCSKTEAYLWDLDTNKRRTIYRSQSRIGTGEIRIGLKRLVILDSDGIHSWSWPELKPVGELPFAQIPDKYKRIPLLPPYVLPNDRVLLGNRLKKWSVWNLKSAEKPEIPLQVFKSSRGYLHDSNIFYRVSPDRTFLIQQRDEKRDDGIRAYLCIGWNLTTGEQFKLPGLIVSDVGENNRVVVAGEEKQALLYDLLGRRAVCVLKNEEPVEQHESLLFFDLSAILQRRADRRDVQMRIWDAQSGEPLTALPQRLLDVSSDYRFASNMGIETHNMSLVTHDFDEWLFVAPSGVDIISSSYAFDNMGIKLGDDEMYYLGSPYYQCCFIGAPGAGTRLLTAQTWGYDYVTLWSRRHPEWWWGHFYRPEVWAGIVLAGIWLLKLWRRIFRRTAHA